jgi:hypothetical protein
LAIGGPRFETTGRRWPVRSAVGFAPVTYTEDLENIAFEPFEAYAIIAHSQTIIHRILYAFDITLPGSA